MAESVVMFFLEKLTSLLETELRQQSGVRDEINNLQTELEQMKAFLRDADAMEDDDERIKVWVKQVRELSLEAEYVINAFLLLFVGPRPRGRLCWHVKMCKARHRAASKLQRIRSRAAIIAESRHRYNFMSAPTRGRSFADILYEGRNDARLPPEARLAGINTPRNELVKLLLSDTRVVVVWGTAGSGKTTLVGQVYQDPRIKKHYQHRVWITVSDPFNEQDLLTQMIKQLPIPGETQSKDSRSLGVLKNFLSDKKSLIVADDVLTPESWEFLKRGFPDNNDDDYGSHLIVTTRDHAPSDYVKYEYPMTPLSPEQSWDLFRERAFQNQTCPRNLNDVSRGIVERCDGLPLGIVAISGVLATLGANPDEWERVRTYLEAEPRNNNEDRLEGRMKKILSLSFGDLPYDLKSCFMYLTMFPEDWLICKQHIIHLWISEGFLRDTDEGLTSEEVGDLYFKVLRNRGLIKVAQEEEDNTGEDYCMFRVHHLIRDFVLRKAKDQGFSATVREPRAIVPKRVQRLLLADTSLKDKNGVPNLSRLRTVIFLRSGCSISELEFLKNCGVKLLNVLNCSGLSIKKFPDFVTTQYNLKYLNLRGSSVKSIPSSIRQLRNLLVLDLRETLVEELPRDILEIHDLRHILVTRRAIYASLDLPAYVGVRVPTEIGTLTSLQTLLSIEVSTGDSDLISSLGKLTQLRTLDIKRVQEEHGPALCLSLEKMRRLRELRIESSNEDEILNVQNMSSPSPNIKQLFMSGRLSRLPSWVLKLGSLVQLVLMWSKLEADPLRSLQALPNLEQLRLTANAYEGSEMSFEARGFRKLTSLWLTDSRNLRRINVEKGAMPRLRELRLIDCGLLDEVPTGIKLLTSLDELYLFNVGDELLTRLRSTGGGSDFRRIEHIASLHIGSWTAERGFEPYQ